MEPLTIEEAISLHQDELIRASDHPLHEFRVEETWEETYQSDTMLSFRMDHYRMSSGAAEPVRRSDGRTLNLKTGEVLKLGDLLQVDPVSMPDVLFNLYVEYQEQLGSGLADLALDPMYIQSVKNQCTNDAAFWLDPSGINVYFHDDTFYDLAEDSLLHIPFNRSGLVRLKYIPSATLCCDAYLKQLLYEQGRVYTDTRYGALGRVVICDICGDETPELVYTVYHSGWHALYVWQCVDGQLVRILEGNLGQEASAGVRYGVAHTDDEGLIVMRQNAAEFASWVDFEKYDMLNGHLELVDRIMREKLTSDAAASGGTSVKYVRNGVEIPEVEFLELLDGWLSMIVAPLISHPDKRLTAEQSALFTNEAMSFEEAIQALTEVCQIAQQEQKAKALSQQQPAQQTQADQSTQGTTQQNLSITCQQVDMSAYPQIKLYLTIEDEAGNTPDNLTGGIFYLSEKRSMDPEYIEREITRVVRLGTQEGLTIHLVADTSGSMDGTPIARAKQIIVNFLGNVQFGIGDRIQLTEFDSYVTVVQSFTDDRSLLSNSVAYLYASGQTALYDALYYALHSTAIEQGAKCIVAFTDGADNMSSVTPGAVIDDSIRYRIPIFIIGVNTGNYFDTSVLSAICDETGGFFTTIDSIDALQTIYEQVYAAQKDLYLMEYTADEQTGHINDIRDFSIRIQSDACTGESTFTFEPHLLLKANETYAGQDEIDAALAAYLRGFIRAIQTKNFNELAPTLVYESPIYYEQQNYILSDFSEELVSYEILSKWVDHDVCTLRVRENYLIDSPRSPLYMLTQIAHYRLWKMDDGWRFYCFEEPVEVVQIIQQ